MKIQHRFDELPDKGFTWRTKGGEAFISPSDMETRHLFYTLRMIWNHSMPQEFRIEPYKRYVFDSFYTDEYMKKAITSIGRELFKRSDLLPYWKEQLEYMASKFTEAQNNQYLLTTKS